MSGAMLGDRAAVAAAGIAAGVSESQIHALLQKVEQKREPLACVKLVGLTASSIRLRLEIPFAPPVMLEGTFDVQIRRRGVERRLVIGTGNISNSTTVDQPLIR